VSTKAAVKQIRLNGFIYLFISYL